MADGQSPAASLACQLLLLCYHWLPSRTAAPISLGHAIICV